MKAKLLRICAALAALFLFLGLPALHYADRISALLGGNGADAASSATLELPGQPSGEFVVLLNVAKHPDTLAQWTDFFKGRDVDVIFEDLDCLVVDTDAAGIQLAERYQARLAEHQMSVRRENGTLAVSRAQWGAYDVLILSSELADAYALETAWARADACRILVKGGEV